MIQNSLPDFKSVRSFSDIHRAFVDVARTLLFRSAIVRDDLTWRISALELYLVTADDIWQDPYAHKHNGQRQHGTWYVHRPHWALNSSGSESYRNPRRSGLDITCGSESPEIFAGLLVQQTDKDRGSGTTFTKLVRGNTLFNFKNWEYNELALINRIDGQPADKPPLQLKLATGIEGKLWVGPRKGLSKKHADCRSKENYCFRDAPLRAASWKAGPQMREWPFSIC